MAPQTPITQQTGTKPEAPELFLQRLLNDTFPQNCGGPASRKTQQAGDFETKD